MSEVVIVGGGIAGLSAACLLATHADKVTVVEPRTHLPELGDTADPRTVALSRRSIQLLAELGAWAHLDQDRACHYQRMMVWEAAIDQALRFTPEFMDAPDLGAIVENTNLLQALDQTVAATDNVSIRTDRLAHLSLQGARPRLRLASGAKLEADLLIGADGADSPLRERAGIGVQRKDYHARALVARIVMENGHRDTAWQRFLPTGPLALLPQFDGSCALVWSSTEAKTLLAQDDVEFLAALNTALGQTPLGDAVAASERRSFPLRLQMADHSVREGLALIGDAAHAVHPLAGQGINLGLADVAALSAAIGRAADKGRPLGELRSLQAYAREREAANRAMGLSFDLLEKLFRADGAAIGALRRAGLSLVGRTPGLSEHLARAAGA